jgi:hypothetical protein
MGVHQSARDGLVISYLGLRKAVGIIGVALPFVLVFGKMLLDGPGIQDSISGYYYTSMHDVFVGSVCAIAVFMMSYHGPEKKDDIAGDIACAFALGVALFPTSPFEPTSGETLIGRVHLACAAGLFLTLAYFCLALFCKTDPARVPVTRKKRQRNGVYYVCGYTILACIALIAVAEFLPEDSPLLSLQPVFWLEAIAVVAFGMAWLTKGEAILKDQPETGTDPITGRAAP